MSLLQAAEAISQRRQVEKREAVNALAYRQVYDEDVTPEDIVVACEAAGVSLDDYSKEISRLERRKALLAKAATQPELEAQQRQYLAEMEKASAELKAAQDAYAAVFVPAQQQHQLLGSQIGEAIQAREELRRSCKAPAIVARINEIGMEILGYQDRQKHLIGRQRFLASETARLEPQLADQIARRNRLRPSNYPPEAVSYTPGDHDPREQERLEKALASMRDEAAKAEELLAGIPGKVAALENERQELLAKAESSPV